MNKNILYSILFAVVLIILSACESAQLDIINDPNALTPDQADAQLLLLSAQVDLAQAYEEGQEPASEVTRMTHMFGPLYINAYTVQEFDNYWFFSNAGALQDLSIAIPTAETARFFPAAAAGKIMQSYILTTHVDLFGDVPFTEALQGADNLNPSLTSGADVYAAAETLLNEAIVDLTREAVEPATGTVDLFFGGTVEDNVDEWRKVAKALLFRIYVNTRLVDANAATKAQALIDGAEVGGVVSSDSLMSASSDSFSFKWSTNSQPESRHPEFFNNYSGNGAQDYMNHFYMNLFVANNDPRTRYYFYRQETSNTTDLLEQNCIGKPRPSWYSATDTWCQEIGSGYWGRDHGDNDGIPPDGIERTVFGVYPIGGLYDAGQDTDVDFSDGGQGQGISPLFMNSYLDFLRAEAALVGMTDEDPAALLQAAVTKSINAVGSFSSVDAAAPAPTIGTYVTDLMTDYGAAADDAARLDIIITEYYKAAFGNGIEAYNAYRRTGYPDDMQPTATTADPGAFPRTFFYPANLVFRNSSVSQKSLTDQTFWDNGSTTLK